MLRTSSANEALACIYTEEVTSEHAYRVCHPLCHLDRPHDTVEPRTSVNGPALCPDANNREFKTARRMQQLTASSVQSESLQRLADAEGRVALACVALPSPEDVGCSCSRAPSTSSSPSLPLYTRAELSGYLNSDDTSVNRSGFTMKHPCQQAVSPFCTGAQTMTQRLWSAHSISPCCKAVRQPKQRGQRLFHKALN